MTWFHYEGTVRKQPSIVAIHSNNFLFGKTTSFSSFDVGDRLPDNVISEFL